MNKSTYDVAAELEHICEKEFSTDFYHTNTLFDRSVIEKDMFFDVMVLLMHINPEDGDKAQEFIDRYLDYRRVPMTDIPNYENIFNEFKKIV